MNLHNLIKSANHNDLIETYSDGIKYLIESKSDIVSYNTQKNLTLFNVAVLEVDKKGNYIYEYILERQADIIENIYIISSNDNIKMTFIIGGEEYDYINTFISMLSQYHEFKLKFIFSEKPTIDDKMNIAKDKMIPDIIESFNFKKDKYINLDNELLSYIINNKVPKEEGVRQLRKCLEKIFSKLNYYILTGEYENHTKYFKVTIEYQNNQSNITINIKRAFIDKCLESKEDNMSHIMMYV